MKWLWGKVKNSIIFLGKVSDTENKRIKMKRDRDRDMHTDYYELNLYRNFHTIETPLDGRVRIL